MAKTCNFPVKGNGYESPCLRFTLIDEDVVTASGVELSWGNWTEFEDTRDNTFMGGNN